MATCVFVMTKILENATQRAHKQEAVSDWLNPHSLGTMSAIGCVENLA